MRRAILRDIPGKKVHDLNELAVKNDDEISLGRDNGNVIRIGEGFSDEKATETRLATISRNHATITYSDIEKFCIRDHSTNGTRINKTAIKSEADFLRSGDEIFFGAYGPFIYEEII